MKTSPVLLSTWSFAQRANDAAWPTLARQASALDAVEAVCRHVEEDPTVDSVGYGGLPDHQGRMTLDASIMLSPSRSGAVCAMSNYLPVISVARAVMEHTRHALLAGSGAEEFASAHGFDARDLLSPAALKRWQAKRTERGLPSAPPERSAEGGHDYEWPDAIPATDPSGDEALIEPEGHDTVGSLALDAHGVVAGACSTSGLAFKRPGRVGDSPIIGQGLFVEPGIGGAVVTGLGELATGVCAAHVAIESLRNGDEPKRAAVAPLERIVEHFDLHPQHQLAVLVLAADGGWSAASLRPGYVTSVRTAAGSRVVRPETILFDTPGSENEEPDA
ncbi:MAG: isoaspartyl peptidase/L-asparaginase [Planctomycetota bacterium]